jgi:hypothetical protein
VTCAGQAAGDQAAGDDQGVGWADDYLLTPAEAAEILRTKPAILARFSNAGGIPAVRVERGHRRYRWGDVRAVAGLHAFRPPPIVPLVNRQTIPWPLHMRHPATL